MALTIPAVTEKSKLNGDPIATTQSPTFNSLLLPIFTEGKSSPLTFKTARSDNGSTPITSALNSLLSDSDTTTSVASSTTWKFVIIKLFFKIKPEP